MVSGSIPSMFLPWNTKPEMTFVPSFRRFAAKGLVIPVVCGLLPVATAEAQNDQAANLDAYRQAVLTAPGDADRGRKLFENVEQTQCASCHALGGQGAALGPDLAGLGGDRWPAAEILESILHPSARIHPDYASTVVALKSGRVLNGLVRPGAEGKIEIVTSATEVVRVTRDEIDEQSPSLVSLMPEGLHERLKPAEMADLLAFLTRAASGQAGSLAEAMQPGDIPRARVPVSFRPILPTDEPFRRPVWCGPLPGQPGSLVVIEMQGTKVWLLEEGGTRRALFADLHEETTPGELTGLTSIAFHPNYAQNGRYFLEIHAKPGPGERPVQIIERQADADRRRDSGQPSRLVLEIPVTTGIHNGGHLDFGPDGLLYIGMGDTGPQGDPLGHGQDMSTHLGKILRIDVDQHDADRPYSIPADNPFRDQAGARPEIFAFGFREPWRFSFDSKTGDLWVGDVGQGLYEEVALVRAGENHGWNVVEGFRPFSDKFARPGSTYVPPVFAYHHRVGVSVTGGFVYRGARYPALVGKYIFGDYETRRLWALETRDRRFATIVEIGRAPERFAAFGIDHEGELYLVGNDRGQIYELDAHAADLTATLPARELVPTARLEPVSWRYTETEPPTAWQTTDFDATAWKEGPGGFGTRGTPGAVVRTTWKSEDIWMRRSFDLANPLPTGLSLSVHHDEEAEIYLNGVLAAKLGGFTGDYDEIEISEQARASLKPGRNVLAVHCHQNRGGQYIDAGILQTRPPITPTP